MTISIVTELQNSGFDKKQAVIFGSSLEKIFEERDKERSKEIDKLIKQISKKPDIATKTAKQQNTDLATKQDLKITGLELQKEIELTKKEIEVVRKEIEVVRKELKSDIAESKNSILKWVLSFLIAQTGLLITVITLLK